MPTIIDTTPATTPVNAAPPREWLRGEGPAYWVLDLLREHGWAVVTDPMANAHATSPDHRVYVGFLPEAPGADHLDLWSVTVCDDGERPGWTQNFSADTPAELIRAFLSALIDAPHRVPEHED